MKALVVEDDLLSRKLMLLYLAPYGECDFAVNGLEGVELFIAAAEKGGHYDLITLDIMMPEMNGQEVLQEIRRIEMEKGLVKSHIFMTTALKDFENAERSYGNSCDGYLVKPINREVLKEMLSELGLIG